MKTMRIGSSIINLDAIYDINCVKREKGTVVRVEYPHAVREYLVPDFFEPETVAIAIQRGINGQGNSRSLECFDLIAKLEALDRIYGGIRVNETKNES